MYRKQRGSRAVPQVVSGGPESHQLLLQVCAVPVHWASEPWAPRGRHGYWCWVAGESRALVTDAEGRAVDSRARWRLRVRVVVVAVYSEQGALRQTRGCQAALVPLGVVVPSWFEVQSSQLVAWQVLPSVTAVAVACTLLGQASPRGVVAAMHFSTSPTNSWRSGAGALELCCQTA
mmetsp:Transcript_5029/g.13914  ORF Transcript_5029/g.13914 Transcript_5029/m.13914 type:complete len:176 (+) Transcript_5029:163-690(+)